YDIDMDKSLTPEDLEDIEREMKRIVDSNLPIERIEVSRDDAINMFKDIGDDLKIELIADIPEDEQVTIYKQGEFLIYVVVYMCHQQVRLKYLNYLISQE